jgi:predicted TIM-barrel fold metal-dependent hydrolase
VNKFIAASVKAHPDRFIGFGSLHPDMENAADAVAHMQDEGLRGVKLHPDMQLFAMDEPRALKMFESFAGKLPLLVHAGDKRYQFSNPHRIARAMDCFPEMKVIAAHMGGYSEWDEAEKMLAGRKNLYVDTSSTMFELDDARMLRAIHAFGADKVMFASDYPMWNPGEELKHLRNLGLSEEELQKIVSGTAKRLFRL